MKEIKKKGPESYRVLLQEETSHKVTRTSTGSELHQERFSHEEITINEELE